ncbi:MAG: hypothetical protein RL547_48 [Actinomycetota bacterium]
MFGTVPHMNAYRRRRLASLVCGAALLVACGGDDTTAITTEVSTETSTPETSAVETSPTTEAPTADTMAADSTLPSADDPLDEFAIWDFLNASNGDVPYEFSVFPGYFEDTSPRTLRINVTTDEAEDLLPICRLVADYIDENAPGAELRIEVFDDIELSLKAVREMGGDCTAT